MLGGGVVSTFLQGVGAATMMIPATALYVSLRATTNAKNGTREYLGKFIAARWTYAKGELNLLDIEFKGSGLTEEQVRRFKGGQDKKKERA